MAPTDASDKSRGIALALATVLGPFGAHRFYVGKIGTGLCQLFTFGGLGIWWLYDWILVTAGSFRDVDDRRVVNWAEGETSTLRLDNESGEKLEMLMDEMYSLHEEIADLGERVDFMERMLANVRQREAIPPAQP
jgi:hypothetical protein